MFENVAAKGGFDQVTLQQQWPTVAKEVLSSNIQGTERSIGWREAALVKQLHRSRLYDFERMLRNPQAENRADIGAKHGIGNIHKNGTSLENAEANPISHALPQPLSARFGTNSVAHINNGNQVKREPVPSPIESLDKNGEPHTDGKTAASVSSRPLSRSQQKRIERTNLSASTLMELFSTRPEFGRPLTWRHQLDSNPSTIMVQDYTKSPIPRVSSRILGRQREGLLLRRVERALSAEENQASERSAALNALITRTWSKGFFLALYPTLLDPIVNFAAQLMANLQSAGFLTPLLNNPVGDQDSPLSHLLRISTIFRNLSGSSHNVVLLASHNGALSTIAKLVVLPSSLRLPSSSHSLLQLQELVESLKAEEPSRYSDISTIEQPSIDTLQLLESLKTSSCEAQFNDIQINALEALCKIVSVLQLAPDRAAPQSQYVAPTLTSMEISSQGAELLEVMPVLVEIATSATTKATTLFLSVELLARLLMNSNSRPLWKSLPFEYRVNFIQTMIRYAMLDDEISDWALLGAMHFALNAFDLAVVLELTSTSAVVDKLMLMLSSYSTSPKAGTVDFVQHIAYRRHSFALRSAVILHRLVEFVSMKHLLLPYEELIANVILEAPAQISDAIFAVFLDMQS